MKWIKLFIYSAGAILLVTAFDRFLVAARQAQLLTLPEPVLGMPLRYAVLLVGALELTVTFICLFGRRIELQLGWLAWLATNYTVYRIGLFAMGMYQQGTCIGSLTDPLHLASGATGTLVQFIPLYLLVGSCTSLLWLGFGARRVELWQKEKKEAIKMSCPACGRHIKFAATYLGQKISCPQCQKKITLRKPEETLKISCYFCQEHIEFPYHAIGEKMPCPHCKMDITLKEPA